VFDALRAAGEALGFTHVQASPLTRSSYHAREAAAVPAGGTGRGPGGPGGCAVPVTLSVR